MKTPEFKVADLNNIYREDGYVHLKNVLNKEEINELLALFELHYPTENLHSTLWNSLCDIPHDKSKLLSDQILKVVKPRLDEHITNYVSPAATFLVKNPTDDGLVTLHRDFSVQDEPEFSYQNIWLPLVNTNEENGRLCVLPKGHKLFNYPLPHNTVWPYLEYEQIMLKHCHFVDAKAGDLIVYSDMALHASFPNRTNTARPVVHFGLLHPEAKLYYYYLDNTTNLVTVYEVPYQFFFENAWGNQDHRFPVLKKFKYEPPVFSANQIKAWIESNVLSAIA